MEGVNIIEIAPKNMGIVQYRVNLSMNAFLFRIMSKIDNIPSTQQINVPNIPNIK